MSTQSTYRTMFVALCISCAMIGLYISQFHHFRSLDYAIYDSLLQLSAHKQPSQKPLFIDIDEKSLEAYGQWPWPRDLIASTLETLSAHKAAAIALDILFAEPDRSSQANDDIFADILAKTPSVLGTYVNSDKNTLPLALPPVTDLPHFDDIAFFMTDTDQAALSAHIPQGTHALLPLPKLRAVSPLGNITSFMDHDGVIRSLPLLMTASDRIFLSLALRTYMRAYDIKTVKVYGDSDGLHAVQVGDVRIPVQPDGSVLLPYRAGKNVYQRISIADVLQGKIAQEDIEGRFCVIGASATGLHDIVKTPLALQYPGAAIHLSLLDSIDSQHFMTIPRYTHAIQIACMLGMGLICALLLPRLSALMYSAVLFLLLVLPPLVTWFLFQNSVFLSPLYTTLLVGALALYVRPQKKNIVFSKSLLCFF